MEQHDLPLEYPCVNPCLLCVLPHSRLSFLFGVIEWAGNHNGISHFSDENNKTGNVLHFGLPLGRCVLCASLKIQWDEKEHTCQRWRDMSVSREIAFCSVFEPCKSTLLSRLLKSAIPTPFASAVDRGSEVSKDLLFLCRRPYKEWHGSSTGAKLLECYPILWQAQNITQSAADCLKSSAFSGCNYKIFRKCYANEGTYSQKDRFFLSSHLQIVAYREGVGWSQEIRKGTE